MAWLPGAIRKEVKRHRTSMARYDGVCNHIAVSNGASLFGLFNQPGNPTSHFYIRTGSATPGATMADFEQYVDTRYRAPANLEGNHRLISIETQGGVGINLDDGWNGLQLERLAWILAQCHRLHGVPLAPMPDSRPSSRGLGYHRLGVAPWRVDGGERWSKATGKVCPGTARINQQGSILARARVLAGGALRIEGSDMQFSDPIPGYQDADGTPKTVGEALVRGDKAYSLVTARTDSSDKDQAHYAYEAVTEGGVIDRRIDVLQKAVADLTATVSALTQKVDALLKA